MLALTWMRLDTRAPKARPRADAVLEPLRALPAAAGLYPARNASAVEEPREPGLADNRDIVPRRLFVKLGCCGEREVPAQSAADDRRVRGACRYLCADAGRLSRVFVQPERRAPDLHGFPVGTAHGVGLGQRGQRHIGRPALACVDRVEKPVDDALDRRRQLRPRETAGSDTWPCRPARRRNARGPSSRRTRVRSGRIARIASYCSAASRGLPRRM